MALIAFIVQDSFRSGGLISGNSTTLGVVNGTKIDAAAFEEAFRLTGFFFHRHVYEPRGMEAPEARAGFLAALRKSLSNRNGEDAA